MNQRAAHLRFVFLDGADQNPWHALTAACKRVALLERDTTELTELRRECKRKRKAPPLPNVHAGQRLSWITALGEARTHLDDPAGSVLTRGEVLALLDTAIGLLDPEEDTPCCGNESRTMDGGCTSCGDPAY